MKWLCMLNNGVSLLTSGLFNDRSSDKLCPSFYVPSPYFVYVYEVRYGTDYQPDERDISTSYGGRVLKQMIIYLLLYRAFGSRCDAQN